jgi:hypothetical protein
MLLLRRTQASAAHLKRLLPPNLPPGPSLFPSSALSPEALSEFEKRVQQPRTADDAVVVVEQIK